MPATPRFDFDAPAETSIPFQGSTPQSAHASWTGARHAAETRSANIVALKQLWTVPRTIQDVAAIMKLPIASVCSLKAALPLEPVGFEPVEWGDGRRPTKRTLWRLKPESG